MKIERAGEVWIRISDKDGGVIVSKSVEANLLFEILKELKKAQKSTTPKKAGHNIRKSP
ncbi:hypothetical protein HY498_05070 [Candidatus Woesearchaeota archaeon]|nr:hypothetical protein [Candidatus Woesearchaeota archaeon]